GDRGGILNIKELMSVTEIDFIARAPDGKEVEELTMKEIHKALRSRVVPEQIKNDLAAKDSLRQPIVSREERREERRDRRDGRDRRDSRDREPRDNSREMKKASDGEIDQFAKVLDDLIGSHAAALLDEKM